MNSWLSLPRPFLMLAPLEGVADTVFRQIVSSCAKPDLFVTEFTSADGYCSAGKDVVMQNFQFTPQEAPIVAQLWGRDPGAMYKTAKDVAAMGFFGIDINMGCPQKNVIGHGCGAAMVETPEIAASVIAAAKQGIKDSGRDIPFSVKTRIGMKNIVTEQWISFLLAQGLDALTIHGRTAKEMSKVPAHWDEIAKAVTIRDRMGVSTVIIGNGDVRDAKDAIEKAKIYGVDGVMIGRGIFSNLWAFDRTPQPHMASPRELVDIMERHVTLFTETWQGKKSYAILKKFFKIYINGFPDATAWRVRCMATESAEEVLSVLRELKESDILHKV